VKWGWRPKTLGAAREQVTPSQIALGLGLEISGKAQLFLREPLVAAQEQRNPLVEPEPASSGSHLFLRNHLARAQG